MSSAAQAFDWSQQPSTEAQTGRSLIVVEDDSDLQTILTYNLQKSGFKVRCYSKAEDVLKVLDSSPDMIPEGFVVDVNLAGNMNGVELTKFLREKKETAKLPILMLTAKTETNDVVHGLNQGADDYLPKPFEMDVLKARINSCLRRADSHPGPVKGGREKIAASGIHIDPVSHKVSVDGLDVHLTAFEYGLLVSFMSRPNEVLSRDDLLLRIVGPNKVVTGRTIDVHIRALRSKMGSRGRHISTVRGFGYKFVP
jgi:two-component system, OmpR family, alkaline phosphatase synthesis response regulator PhoP